MGTYISLIIEEKLSFGMVILRRVITEDSPDEIISFMQAENYGITPFDTAVSIENEKIILSLVNRGDVPCITVHLLSTNSPAFFSIEDVRYDNEGVFHPKKPNAFTVCFTRSFDPGRKITLIIRKYCLLRKN